ncbi:MAG: hypothetical protein E7486_00440 [Ruminococcaceae bacterium]|nr:hypothetical protein [Oscillospiraceae bacterium]
MIRKEVSQRTLLCVDRMKKIKHIRLYSALLAAILFAGSISLFGQTAEVSAATQSELQQQINDLENQQAELKKQLAQAEKDQKSARERLNLVTKQIDVTEQQVEKLEQQIISAENMVAQQEARLGDLEAQAAETEELFRQRMRAMYIAGTESILSVLFSSGSFSEFLSRVELTSAVVEHDNRLIEQMEKERTEIDRITTGLENQKQALELSKKTAEAKKKELQTQQKTAEDLIAQIGNDKQEISDDLKEIEQSIIDKEEQIKEILAAANSNKNPGQYAYGKWLWPVPNYSRISSQFGWRWLLGKKDYHTGIDIAGTHAVTGIWIKDQPIIASNDGVVSVAKYQTTGYGYHVMIDHGYNEKGVRVLSVYGHCNKLLVKVGDVVKKGQTIAKVGTTGFSTGYHLHFEIRENGVAVNPWKTYVQYGN